MYEVLLLVIAGSRSAAQLATVLFCTVPYQFFEYAYRTVQYGTRTVCVHAGGPQGGVPPGLMNYRGVPGGFPPWLKEKKGGPRGVSPLA